MMSREELLAMLQEKGLSDDDIKMLLKETLDTLDKDFADADEKEVEQAEAADEDKDAEAAGKLLGVEF